MKRKFFVIFLIMMTVIAACIALASCDEHEHVFDQKITTSKYRVHSANCTEAAEYYYSCKCDEKGREKFVDGQAKGHEYIFTVGGDYKTQYFIGEIFDTTGMVVKKICTACADEQEVVDYSVSFSPLQANDQELTVSVEGMKAVTLKINVNEIGVIVKNVTIKAEEDKVLYVVSGRYDFGVDVSTLSFDLKTVDAYYTWVEPSAVQVEIDTETSTFNMSADITDMSADGQALYPHIHVNNKVFDIVNKLSADWDGQKVKTDKCTYAIEQNTDTEVYPYAMPVVIKTTEQKVTDDAYYRANSADLIEKDGNVFLVVYGDSVGYTHETLSRDIMFQLRVNNKLYISGTQGGPLILADNGEFTLYVNVTWLSIYKFPYYTRLGAIRENGDVSDLRVPAPDGKTITLNHKRYELYSDRGEEQIHAYGTVGVFVQAIN